MAEKTRCPQCGFNASSALECPRCGVVFAKYRKGESSPTPGPVREDPRDRRGLTPPPKRFTLLPWLVGLVAVIAVIAAFDAPRREEVKPDATPQREERPTPAAPDPSSQPALEPDWVPLETTDDGFSPETVQAPQPSVSASYTWYEGASGFQRGIEEAEREGKALAIYFYTDWCPYCRELESELLNRAKVEESLKYLVKIRVNPESGARERSLANAYGVRGYPSFFIQSTPGATPQKIRRTDRDGLKSPEEFVSTLERAAR